MGQGWPHKGGAATKSRAPAPLERPKVAPPGRGHCPQGGDPRSPDPQGRGALLRAGQWHATRAGPRRPNPSPAGAGEARVGPGSACGGGWPGSGLTWLPPPGQAQPASALWARAWGVGRPPLPWGGVPPPTAVGLRGRSSVNVVGVHNLVIMAPILGSWHMISHDPSLNFDS
jgi:hypothetical protein